MNKYFGVEQKLTLLDRTFILVLSRGNSKYGCFCNVPDGIGTSFPDNQTQNNKLTQKQTTTEAIGFDRYRNTQSEYKALLS